MVQCASRALVEELEGRRLLSAVVDQTVARINFQQATSDTPAGYLADVGLAYGNRGGGLSFGWNKDNTAYARDRDSGLSPNQLYDTFNHLQKRHGASKWEIAVPTGTYLVHLASGDSNYTDSNFRLNVEGVMAVNGVPDETAHWFDQSVVVAVKDGRLTVSNATGSQNNKINFIEITRVADATPLTTGVPQSNIEQSAGGDGMVTPFATASSNDYNFDGATHNAQYIMLNKSNVPLYDGSGNPLGLYINNGPSGIRFQGIEMIDAAGKDWYYTWGLGGVDGQSGHVHVADMVARPSLSFGARGGSGGLYNGRSAPDIILSDGTKKSYYVDPQAIPSDMYYIGPSDGLRHHYDNYGLAGSPYSSNHTPLVWSWVNKSGGGITRIQMLRDEVYYPSDVNTITIASTDVNGVQNGSVKAMYGSIWNGTSRIYGWTVHSHIYNGVYTAHLRLNNG